MFSAQLQFFFLLLTSLVAVACLSACGLTERNETQARQPANVVSITDQTASDLHIKVAPLERRIISRVIHATGQIHEEFGKEVDVSARIAGRVTETFVHPGNFVRNGQPLLKIDSQQLGDIQAELIEVKSQLQIAMAQEEREHQIYTDLLRGPKALIESHARLEDSRVQFELAESELKRQSALFKDGISSAKEFTQAQGSLRQAEAFYKQAKIDLEREENLFKDKNQLKRDYLIAQAETGRVRQHFKTLKQRLLFLGMGEAAVDKILNGEEINAVATIAATTDGIITFQDVYPGEMIDAGKRVLVVTDLSSVAVSAEVPETDLPFVTKGCAATVQIASFPGECFKGTIDYIGHTVRADTRTVLIRARLNNPGLRLKQNMFAEIDVEAQPAMALVCPRSALHQVGGRNMVYVKGRGGYEERTVTVGRTTENFAEILSGAREGEQVVTEGGLLFKAQLTARKG